jgi:hypothetical protein
MRLANMKIRQAYFSENHYKNFLREHDEVIEFFKSNKFKSDTAEEEASLRSDFFQTLALDKLLASYTAGENIEKLVLCWRI